MRRGTSILIVFILIVAGIIGVSFFLRSQPPLEIRLSVSPLAETWLRDASAAFNASNAVINGTQAVRVSIEPLDETAIAPGESGRWTEQTHPDGWIPAAAFTLDYGRAQGLPLETLAPSVAQTPLVWGGFGSLADQVTDGGALPFDWPAVNAALATQPIRLAFRSPSTTIDGFAMKAWLSAATRCAALRRAAGSKRRFRPCRTPPRSARRRRRLWPRADRRSAGWRCCRKASG